MRIAAVGDLHVRESSNGSLRELFRQIRSSADTLLICGDLTDHGLPVEAEVLGDCLATIGMPAIGVLGNHDLESGQQDVLARILGQAGLTLLDTDGVRIDGIGFAGVKGFCGGFGQAMLQPWGEPTIKRFVYEAIDEAMKLESQLTKLHSEKLVVLLHYAPIRSTVEGEVPDVIPYLGSSRLAEPIDRFDVNAVFHGHSHYGQYTGETPGGRVVHNCALPLRRRVTPDQPFALIDL